MIQVTRDIKQDVKFWVDALNNPHISGDNKILINKCLQAELNSYINPIKIIKGDVF